MPSDLKHHALQILDHYVGTWLNQKTIFPTEADPKTTREVVIEQTAWEFDRSFILSRMININTGLKSLWTITLDSPNDKRYRWLYVDSGGWFDYWVFRWDADAHMVFAEPGIEAVDGELPRRWVGSALSSEVFRPDGNYYGMLEAYDEQGKKFLHLIGEKARQPHILGERMLETWNKPGTPKAPAPPEIMRLDCLAGTWHALVRNPADNAGGNPAPGKVQAAWQLDGWALEIRVEFGKSRAVCIFAYDPLIEKYRFYIFSDTDVHQQFHGEWEGDNNNLIMRGLANSRNAETLSIKIVNSDTIEAYIQIEPPDGNMVEMEVILNRAD